MKKALLNLIGGALMLQSASSQSISILSTLEATWPEYGSIGYIHGIWPGDVKGSGFATGEAGFQLNSVLLEHYLYNDPVTSFPGFSVDIYQPYYGSSPADYAVNFIGTLNIPEADSTPTQWPGETALVRYSALEPITLEPFQEYYLVLHTAGWAPAAPAIVFTDSHTHYGHCSVDWFPRFFWTTEDAPAWEWYGGGSWEPPKCRLEGTPIGTLSPCNTPPDVSNARASVTKLWPPNNKFSNVQINGVSDADGDPITIQIIGVTSDEPVLTANLDTTAPDAILGEGNNVKIRAERLSNGTGRFYSVIFSVTDGRLLSPIYGSVQVEVPHDNGNNNLSIDEGTWFNATATSLE